MRRVLLKMTLLFILSSMLTFFVGVYVSEASGTVYIWDTGEVFPSNAPIQRVGDLYTLTDDINESIIIQRDNIVLDGGGVYALQGTGDSDSVGVDLTERSNVTVKGLEIREFGYGILLNQSFNNILLENTVTLNTRGGIHVTESSGNSISENTMTANMNYDVEIYSSSNNSVHGNSLRRILLTYDSTYNHVYDNHITNSGQEGIGLFWSSDNNTIHGNNMDAGGIYGIHCFYSSGQTITGNSIRGRNYGMLFLSSSDNIVAGNNVENNTVGIWLDDCSYNKFFHNNILDNLHNALTSRSDINLWDDGYPSGGNYWSNYTGTDLDRDGIGDSSHELDADNQDNYPLMGPISYLNAGIWNEKTYYVSVSSNSTISGFHFDPRETEKYFSFDVTGPDGTTGFCRVGFSKELLQGPYVVRVNDVAVVPNEVSEGTQVFLYFVHDLSTKTVEVIGVEAISEFQSLLVLSLLALMTLLAAMAYKRRIRN